MSFVSTYRQLVLFDCDDNRLNLFKHHEKYFPKIPSYCQCCIFWNDRQFNVHQNLNSTFRKYSNVHLCPSYSKQINDSSREDVLAFLQSLLSKFSYVLIVHGNDQSYSNIYNCIKEQYGKQKLDLYTIQQPFRLYLPHIIDRLDKKYRRYNYMEFSKSLFLKENKKQSFYSNHICNYDDAFTTYDLQEQLYFKQLTKCKQKQLKLYHLENLLCKYTEYYDEFGSDDDYEEDYDYYLSTMPEQLQGEPEPKINGNIMIKSISCSQCSKMFRSIHSLNQHFDAKHAASIYSNIIHKSNPQHNTTLPISDEKQIKTESTYFNKSQQTTKEKRKMKKAKDILCSECAKKFKSTLALENHYNIKHAVLTIQQPTKQKQPKKKTKNKSIIESIFCYQCGKIFQSYLHLEQHFYMKHVAFTPFTIIDNLSIFYYGTAHIQENQQCEPLSINYNQNQRATTQKQSKTKIRNTSTLTSVSCSQCNKTFKSTSDLGKHFKVKHIASTPSTTISNYSATKDETTQKQPKKEIKNNSKLTSVSCSECKKIFKSTVGLKQHVDVKHGMFNTSKIILSLNDNATFAHAPHDYQDHPKEITSVDERLEHLETEKDEIKSTTDTSEKVLVDDFTKKCREAKFATIVYMSLKSSNV